MSPKHETLDWVEHDGVEFPKKSPQRPKGIRKDTAVFVRFRNGVVANNGEPMKAGDFIRWHAWGPRTLHPFDIVAYAKVPKGW